MITVSKAIIFSLKFCLPSIFTSGPEGLIFKPIAIKINAFVIADIGYFKAIKVEVKVKANVVNYTEIL